MRRCRDPRRSIGWLLAGLLAAGACGCGNDGLPVTPVEGRVFYRGRPLQFGSVIFQPGHGPPARGTIQPDGTFTLSTYRDGDGAVVGRHQVRVACFTTQDPDAPSTPSPKLVPGPPLIPKKYLSFGTSGLTAEVRPECGPFEFQLRDD